MKIHYSIYTLIIFSLLACNSARVKEVNVLTFSPIEEHRCIPKNSLTPDAIQGPKQIFLPVSVQRAKEIVFDAAAPYGYRAPHTSEMNLEFSVWSRNSDILVKYTKRNDVKLKVQMTLSQINGKQGVNILMGSSQIGGLSSYSYVDNIFKTAHCFYTKIDLLKPENITTEKKGIEIAIDESTIIPVRITRTVSSRVSENDDNLEFIVLRDIYKKGILIISKGTRAKGKVTDIEKTGILGYSGKVGLAINSVVATNGQKINLAFSKQKKATDVIGRTIIMGLTATPLFFLHGDEASVSAGQVFDVQVSGKQILQF